MRYLLPLFCAALLSACHNSVASLPTTLAPKPLLQGQAALPPGYRPPSQPTCPSSLRAQAALPPGYRPPTTTPPSSNCPCSSFQAQAILPPGVNPCS